MDIYCVNLRGTHVGLIRKVILMLYLVTALEITFISNFIFVLIQCLCYLIRTGNTHISSLKSSLPLRICVQRAIKAVGGKA